MRFDSVRKNLDRFYDLAWYSIVVLLLFTSLPLVASLIRTNQVAPPAVLPAFLLFGIWLVPEILRGRRFPFLTVPFLAVVTILVVVTCASFFLPIMPVKGRMPLSEVLDALITLCVAAVVYLVAATYPGTSGKLARTLRLLNLAGLILILWNMVQAFFIFTAAGEFPDWMWKIQSWFSIRILFSTRVTGFAYEPSWLGHQLNIVFLPYWLAATVNGYSAHAARLRKLTAENFLLVGGIGTLLLSFSRIGWVSFGLVFTFVALQLTLRIARAIRDRVFTNRPGRQGLRRFAFGLVFTAFLAVYFAAGLATLEIAGRFDPRLTDFFKRIEGSTGFYMFTNRLAFAERAVAWGAGWEIFNEHPLAGVGLGNAGFFFNKEMPAFGWLLYEMKHIYFHESYLFNTKNLWTRILAEGGIVSFVFLLSWIYLIWKSARTIQRSANPLIAVMGTTGVFFVVELAIEGFSIDSFALPYIWFTAGLVTAATHLYLSKEPA